MKILLISYTYPPDLTPRAFRWSAIVQQFLLMGHDVHVVCATTSDLLESTDGEYIHRVPDPIAGNSLFLNSSSDVALKNSRFSFNRNILSLLKIYMRKVWRFFYWPDSSCGWIIPAYNNVANLCKSHNFDCVISSSHPFSGHVVGLLLKYRFSHVRWLVDISDPYSMMKNPSPYNRSIYSLISRRLEEIVLKNSDCISVTTHGTKEQYLNNFSIDESEVFVIPPLLSLPENPIQSHIDDSVVRLVYVGTLYSELRSPEFLLKSFLTLINEVSCGIKFELHFYGAVNDCSDLLHQYSIKSKQSIFVHGLVPREIVHQAMVDSDVLVNIGNNSPVQLASKVLEYTVIGKPILNIVSLSNDSSVVFLNDFPASLTIDISKNLDEHEHIATIANFLMNLPKVDSLVSEGYRKRYSPLRISKDYEYLINNFLLKSN